jgi:hypothetical protein
LVSPDRTGLCRYYNGKLAYNTNNLRKKAQINYEGKPRIGSASAKVASVFAS